MAKKYKLNLDHVITRGTNETKLYRIQALKNFGDVKKGDLGGFVESEHNLSQDGNCWIYNNASAAQDSRVQENAKMYDHSSIHQYAQMFGESELHNYAEMRDNTLIAEHARMYDNSIMYDKAELHDNAVMSKAAKLHQHAKMYDYTTITDFADMHDHSVMTYFATLAGHATMKDCSEVSDYAQMLQCSAIHNDAKLKGDAILRNDEVIYYNTLLESPSLRTLKSYLFCVFNQLPINNMYIFYKRVDKIKKGVYASHFDKKFIYKDNQVAKVTKYAEDWNLSCADGLHVSHPTYWDEGDTLIACYVNIDDIITCQSGKVRVKKLYVIGEVEVPEQTAEVNIIIGGEDA